MTPDQVRLTISDTVAGQPCQVSMTYARALWHDVDEADREQLRLIARYRFSEWVYAEFGVRLADSHLGALPVTAA